MLEQVQGVRDAEGNVGRLGGTGGGGFLQTDFLVAGQGKIAEVILHGGTLRRSRAGTLERGRKQRGPSTATESVASYADYIIGDRRVTAKLGQLFVDHSGNAQPVAGRQYEFQTSRFCRRVHRFTQGGSPALRTSTACILGPRFGRHAHIGIDMAAGFDRTDDGVEVVRGEERFGARPESGGRLAGFLRGDEGELFLGHAGAGQPERIGGAALERGSVVN
ncbi:MAG: hypothetical protein ACK55I_41870, partial [bacterium]